MPTDVIRFEGFEYRRGQQSLSYAGRALTVGSRALALLDALLRRPGVYLSTFDLMLAAWPDTHVDESNLRVQMSALRRLLAPCGRPIVRNAPGRGYAFVGRFDHALPEERDIVLVLSLSSAQFDLQGIEPELVAPTLRAVLQRIELGSGREHTASAEGQDSAS